MYDETMARIDRIRAEGYDVDYIWEHSIKEQLRIDKKMRTFFKNCRHATHMRPREAMFGGRTQVFNMYAEVGQETKSIGYADYCSLYPYVNCTTEYPRGQPRDLRSDTKI
ncbi:unnamed protein product [Caenorhabditis angaria]|uniref:DNA-directed DNA polymerase n=1 Tax=Caenorhabditis angaria TaxID=860376 RepID=A0A9P1MUG6_9PELO|nr:unnamed protein product [Caenorhabditis angaria]